VLGPGTGVEPRTPQNVTVNGDCEPVIYSLLRKIERRQLRGVLEIIQLSLESSPIKCLLIVFVL
jgi:hypothetical protein